MTKSKIEKELIKKGCTLEIKNNYENINFGSETIDKVNFKSLILTMKAWFIVHTEYKATRKIEKVLEQIKNTIKLNSNKYYFNGMLIDVAEIPFTFEEQKNGYVKFEYTIFVNKGVKFNKQEITILMDEMIKVIYDEYFKTPVDYDVYKSRLHFTEK
jgi:hypothetical protein